MLSKKFQILYFIILISAHLPIAEPSKAQTPVDPGNIPPLRDIVPPQETQPLPSQPLQPPPPEELLPTPQSPVLPPQIPETDQTITVTKFEIIGNTIFSTEEIQSQITQDLTHQKLSLSRLLEVADEVAKLYAKAGYSTSGAVISIPKETREKGQGVVIIEVIEGELIEINVTPINESERLNPNYIRSRIAVATGKPLNIFKLQEALQLLQLNPLIETVSAELINGTQPGTSILNVQYASGDAFTLQAILDNNRAPSVGTFRRGVAIEHANLTGLGDILRAEYRNTDGSNDFETFYLIPFNPHDGTVRFRFRMVDSRVITPEFERFDIKSDYKQYELTVRQPVYQTPRREVSLGLIFDRQENKGSIQGQGFPLSPGANLDGDTDISTIRFFQEWLERSQSQVIALRSSFNFGVNAFGVTEPFDAAINPNVPQSNYFMWRGQVQYVRLLAPDTLLLVRSDLQLTSDNLYPLERFTLGGFGSVRGYAENFRLTDNGITFTVEGRIPLYRKPQNNLLLQITPFVDFGHGWNKNTPVESPSTLASVGVGLLFQYSDRINARIDYGLALTDNEDGDSWQENGISFSLVLTGF